MAKIDVSEVLLDTDFIDEMTVITRFPSVSSLGENSFGERVNHCVSVGCVQPATGRVVQKLPEGMRVANISSFWFKGEITATAPCKYSSIIVYQGKRYQVQTVNDWSNWGAGWCEGTCVEQVPS